MDVLKNIWILKYAILSILIEVIFSLLVIYFTMQCLIQIFNVIMLKAKWEYKFN